MKNLTWILPNNGSFALFSSNRSNPICNLAVQITEFAPKLCLRVHWPPLSFFALSQRVLGRFRCTRAEMKLWSHAQLLVLDLSKNISKQKNASRKTTHTEKAYRDRRNQCWGVIGAAWYNHTAERSWTAIVYGDFKSIRTIANVVSVFLLMWPISSCQLNRQSKI